MTVKSWVAGRTCFEQRSRGGLVFKAPRRLYHSTLGLRVIKKKEKTCFEKAHGRARHARQDTQGFTEMCSGSEEGSYPRLIDVCITQL